MSVASPKSFNTPTRSLLNDTDVSSVGAAVLALTRELWVLSDRIAIVEAVLANRGIDISAEVDAFQPDADLQAALDARGQKLVAAVVAALSGLDAG